MKNSNLTEEGKEQAIIVLEHCTKPTGFYASGLPGGYEATWARDSMITSLGASLIESKFQKPFKTSIELLSKSQSELGQIPNAVGSFNTDRQSDVTFNSIDSSLWYLIGQQIYAKSYQDESLLTQYKKHTENALSWLKHQDPNEDKLLAQQPTMDWQDAFPHKYGHVINTQALYYGVLNMYGETKLAEHIKSVVNGEIEKYLAMYNPDLGYYLPWNWKNHDGDREEEQWFDTLGNVLAIVTGLASPKIAESILNYIKKNAVAKPYPCRTMNPPLKKGDKEWRSYFEKSDAKTPYEYLNGGIWPFIGGFYVAALVKMGRQKEAEEQLELLAQANQQINQEVLEKRALPRRSFREGGWGFQEWLHGKTGESMGNSEPYQAWSAGTYLFALESVSQKKVPFF
jgi:glycogen debranching enzyme